MTRFNQSLRRKIDVAGKIFGALLIIAGTVLVTAPALSASDGGCGTYSYGFTGTRLINDGISTSAGPFVIDLPAGTYDITMLSNENHPYPTYQTEQTQEQWFFVLDNGYVSPPTDDVPNDSENVVTNIGEVELAAATAISVKHLGEGGLNSVNVECIGFTPSVVTVVPPVTTEAPAIAGPATTAAPNVVAPTTTIHVDVAPVATVAPVAPATTVQAEVLGVVQTPEPQLAVTGRDTTVIALAGMLLIALGLALVITTARPTGAVR